MPFWQNLIFDRDLLFTFGLAGFYCISQVLNDFKIIFTVDFIETNHMIYMTITKSRNSCWFCTTLSRFGRVNFLSTYISRLMKNRIFWLFLYSEREFHLRRPGYCLFLRDFQENRIIYKLNLKTKQWEEILISINSWIFWCQHFLIWFINKFHE